MAGIVPPRFSMPIMIAVLTTGMVSDAANGVFQGLAHRHGVPIGEPINPTSVNHTWLHAFGCGQVVQMSRYAKPGGSACLRFGAGAIHGLNRLTAVMAEAEKECGLVTDTVYRI